MGTRVNFPGYVAQIRTIDGVVVFDPQDPPDDDTWNLLERNHRHRNVGVPPCLSDEEWIPESETVVSLYYPTETVRELIEAVSEDHPRFAVEALFLASAYVTPMMLYPSALGEIQPYSLWDLYPEIELTEEQLRRHIRVLRYGTVDFHEAMVESGIEAISEGRIATERERRRSIAEADGVDRCWRFFDDDRGTVDEANRWIGGYFDGLPLLTESATSMLESLPDASIVLGVVGGLLVDVEP